MNQVPKLPHGRPFLLIDRVVELGEQRGVFLKHVTATDPCTAPDGTLPAAYVLEALAQSGGALLGSMSTGGTPEAGYLAGVDGFQMHSEARTGDQLRIEVELVRFFAAATLFRGEVRAGERLVADGRFTLALPR